MSLVSFKSLETEEGRREYYTYDPSNPATMVHHAEPYLDPRFNEELLEMFGKDIHGDPILRIAWGGSLRATSFRAMEDGTTREYEGMKYPYMRRQIVKGFIYTDSEGKRVTVPHRDMVPKAKLFAEDIDWDDLGQMKFVLEMKYTYDQMIQINRYPKPGTPEELTWCFKDNRRYRVDPDPNGEYIFCHYIETSDGRFADVTQNTIDSIRGIFYRATTETEKEYVDRKLDERRRLAIAEEENRELNYKDAVENARIKAEKRIARGSIIYG